MVILGRLLGKELSLETLPIENIVPDALREVSLGEFEERLHEFDTEFQTMCTQASNAGRVLRYVGVVDDLKPRVELREYQSDHPFASLQGSDNIIRITTERFPNGLTIQGSGAGADVTAFGIFSDVLRVARST